MHTLKNKKRKLDTIHIHGLNAVIISGLLLVLIMVRHPQVIDTVSAFNIKNSTDQTQFKVLSSDIEIDKKENLKYQLQIEDNKLSDHIIGMSAIVYDVTNSNTLWAIGDNKTYSLASLTKVMTSYIYKEKCDKEVYYTGLRFTSDDAMRYMLIESSNEMADILSSRCMGRELFIQEMNNKAQDLKLNLHYTNPSGMDYPGVIGGRGDVLSMAKFLSIASAAYPQIFDYTAHNSSIIKTYRKGVIAYVDAYNTNQNIDSVSGARLSKTGLTDYAGGNLGIVYDPYIGRTLVLLVLGSTKDGRFTDIDKMKENIVVKYTNN